MSKPDKAKILADIKERKIRIGVIGLGYVGLPLAVEFANAGYLVTGFDVLPSKIDAINAGRNYIADVKDHQLSDLVKRKRLVASRDFDLLKDQDAISICVPTPLSKTGDPDLSYILSAQKEVKRNLRPGQMIVLESTTYPGTTEEVMLPDLQEGGLVVGEDFFLAFSPERIDPGNKQFGAKNTPKVIGGVTPNCSELLSALYSSVLERVVTVSSPRAAEMVKLLENTFRSINIGLVNELAIICNLLKIDVWEVIDAAATKPFGYMPFYPGPGLGGHCIPIDPSYLTWKLRTLNYRTRFIELAVDINMAMPGYVVQKVADALNCYGKCALNSNILILGVSYKRDIEDVRESPAFEIIRHLREKGARVSYHDPYVPQLDFDGETMTSVELTRDYLSHQDCAVIVTDHSNVDYAFVVKHCPLIMDSRNATKHIQPLPKHVMKL
ncbi:MAG TPA: nucleotide sugar dehydrogenase [bacterium]